MTKTRIAVLVSGGGTNLQALIDAQKSGKIHSGEIVLVISNKEGAYALTRAQNAGIPTVTLPRKSFASAKDFEAAMLGELEKNKIDLIVLAGFLSILSADFTSR
ncbi:MAG: phosphoribosylglycinamide formyltransferase, partial [Clostridia bacterium]|nr:phosphoribosylglycinamide formyltransferase [Clostridia bacterium]